MRLSHRVEVQTAERTETAGGVVETWATTATRWAEVSTVSAESQARFASVGMGQVTHRVKFRAPVTVSLKNRLQWQGITLIPTAPPEVRGRFVILLVKEVPYSQVSEQP